MTDPTDISLARTGVAVLTYNKVRLARRCLQSVLAAGWKAGDVLCYHNGSSPPNREEIQTAFPAVQHCGETFNRGFSGGFNRALQEMFRQGYRAVFFLTNDTTITATTLPSCVEQAVRTGAGMVAPAVHYRSRPQAIHSLGGYFDFEALRLCHYQVTPLPKRLDPARDYIPGTALLITRDTFTALSGADETYFTYWEDVDLCFRAHRQKIPLARAADSVVMHSVGATCHKKPVYSSYYYQRNRLLFCSRFLTGGARQRARDRIREEIQDRITSSRENRGPSNSKKVYHLKRILAEFF